MGGIKVGPNMVWKNIANLIFKTLHKCGYGDLLAQFHLLHWFSKNEVESQGSLLQASLIQVGWPPNHLTMVSLIGANPSLKLLHPRNNMAIMTTSRWNNN